MSAERSFAERVANVERYLNEVHNDDVVEIPPDSDFQALLDCILEQRSAIHHLLSVHGPNYGADFGPDTEVGIARAILNKWRIS